MYLEIISTLQLIVLVFILSLLKNNDDEIPPIDPKIASTMYS